MRSYLLIFVIFLIATIKIYSQNLDSLGIDNASSLNEFESDYFNELFKDSKGNFSFNHANVIFVTNPSGNKLISKNEYFNQLVKPWLIKGGKPPTSYKILSKDEKIKSGGYDVIVLSWVKIFTDKRQKKILKKAKKKKTPAANNTDHGNTSPAVQIQPRSSTDRPKVKKQK